MNKVIPVEVRVRNGQIATPLLIYSHVIELVSIAIYGKPFVSKLPYNVSNQTYLIRSIYIH